MWTPENTLNFPLRQTRTLRPPQRLTRRIHPRATVQKKPDLLKKKPAK